MATENLRIEQRNVQTAAFDIKNRILTVPILKSDTSSEVYDLFMGHEVGHALFTPGKELFDALFEQKMNKQAINILEDSRIERKIKAKYPGLRHSFYHGYHELMEKDFFGIEEYAGGKENITEFVNSMNFLDRINMYCKVGAELCVEFSEKEKEILEEVENTQTFQDVLDVYKKVVEHMAEEQEEESEEEENCSSGFRIAGDFDISDEFEELEDGETASDSVSTNGNAAGSGSMQKNQENDEQNGQKKGKKNQNTKNSANIKEFEDQLHSVTEEQYRKNENKLFSDDSRQYHYGNIQNFAPESVIIDHKKLWKAYENDSIDTFNNSYTNARSYNPQAQNRYQEFVGSAQKEYIEFRNSSKSIVSYLVKEFELRKNADQMKRVSIAKTGELNMNKIFSYQFSEDIFKKMAVMPNGKSHGLVMFIDWSGSMDMYIKETIRQLLNLVLFCKKVNIPYEVYAFSDNPEMLDRFNFDRGIDQTTGNLHFGKFGLMNILSSRMNSNEFSSAAGRLLQFHAWNWNATWFQLHGTPLNEAIVAAMNIIPEFQKRNNLQIVNTVFLTDGCSNTHLYIHGNHVRGNRANKNFIVIRDPVTKNEEIVSENSQNQVITTAYLRLLKKRVDCNIIGFYLCSRSSMMGEIQHYINETDVIKRELIVNKMADSFKKQKFCVVENAGYDEYYMINIGSTKTEDEEFQVKENASLRSITTAFSNFNKGKRNNRVVLSRFIELVA
jgi:hypothetical protein